MNNKELQRKKTLQTQRYYKEAKEVRLKLIDNLTELGFHFAFETVSLETLLKIHIKHKIDLPF